MTKRDEAFWAYLSALAAEGVILPNMPPAQLALKVQGATALDLAKLGEAGLQGKAAALINRFAEWMRSP